MKYLKKFENQQEPKKGDYVICQESEDGKIPNDLRSFINNNIGQIIDIEEYRKYPYYIQYENIPEDIREDFFGISYGRNKRQMGRDEITHYSNNKEELEAILTSKKYNL